MKEYLLRSSDAIIAGRATTAEPSVAAKFSQCGRNDVVPLAVGGIEDGLAVDTRYSEHTAGL